MSQSDLAPEVVALIQTLSSLPIVVLITDSEGVIRWANSSITQLTGYPLAEIVGEKFEVLVSDDDKRLVGDLLQHTLNTCDPWTGKIAGKRKSGDSYGSVQTMAPVKNAAGKASHLLQTIVVVRDHESSLELSQQNNGSEILRKNLPVPYQSLNIDGCLLAVNEAWLLELGYSREDVIGHWFGEFLATESVDLFRKLFPIFKERGSIRDVQYRIVRKDGQCIDVSFDGNVGSDTKGQFKETHCVWRDLTERKLIEEQLRQAQKLESIGRLAGGVAHDFNNLLTVINGFSAFIVSGLDNDDSLRQYAEEIQKAGDRAASLTKQLLAFSRKQVVDPKIFDLNKMVRDSVPMLQRLIGEDIAIVTDLDDILGQVRADPDQIHQVVMNLVVNARDAMPNGGRLEIATEGVDVTEDDAAVVPDATPGRFILMSVADSGLGMDETTRQHVFEPFFTTKESGKGTGLGLSTVYGIIRQSGGWLDIWSKVGVGTTMKVYLPHIDARAPSEEEALAPEVDGGGETILVVEDQDAVRSLTKIALEQYGYHVLEASNGGEAIALAKQHSGDLRLLLTDIVLRGMNGKEVSEHLKLLIPNLRVVFTSGYTEEVIVHRGVLDNGVAYIPKPFTPDALAAKVREVLTERPRS